MSRLLKVIPRVPVNDSRPVIAFDSEILGFAVGALWPEGTPCFAPADRDDFCIQFSTAGPARGEAFARGTLSFEADGAAALHLALEGRATVEWGPGVFWYGPRDFAVRDPGGYLLVFSVVTADPSICRDEH
jgi:hypothetical protein